MVWCPRILLHETNKLRLVFYQSSSKQSRKVRRKPLKFRFFSALDANRKWKYTKKKNILVYPEAHRTFDREVPMKVKTGIIKYAYSRKIAVQSVIVLGIADIYNEKTCHYDLRFFPVEFLI